MTVKETTQDEAQTSHRRNKPFSIHAELDLLQWGLFLVALASRTWGLEHPRAIVFDELFYGRFASMYSKNTFYYDSHPPLGKMFIALMGYIGGFDGQANFDAIGTDYPLTTPVWYLRLGPALCGSLLVPVSYQIIILLGYGQWAAGLSATLILLDNALLVESRFILMEMPLLLSMSLGLLSYLKNSQNRLYSAKWWFWLLVLGVSIAVSPSIKYSGLLTTLLLLVLCGKDLWALLPSPSKTDRELWILTCVLLFCLVLLPIMLYLSVFYIHLSILYKAGPHDDMMTSSFQASLEGGLASITKNQPIDVAYGSQITLRHTHGSQLCWLHSHKHVYPIRYSDTRGSSHQQQVTCYYFKDTNNWWIIKDPARNLLMVDDPVRPVKHGDVIQLIHGLTSRALNSHDVSGPVSPQHQEVTCYVDYNISFPAQNLWRVEIVNHGDDQVWRTIESHIRLVHVNTSQALKISGRQLPEWGFNQLEVVTDKNTDQQATVWNVEEHRYTRVNDDEAMERDIANAEMTPVKPTKIGFFAKFWELQMKMLSYGKDAEIEHRFSSDPTTWPLMEKNIAYWFNPHNNAQIHLLGNYPLWISMFAWLLVYAGLLVFHMLRRHRACYDIEENEWVRFKDSGWLLFGGYLINYIPYYMTDRTLFLYHYLPALYFNILLTAALVSHVHHLLGPVTYVRPVFEMLLVAWVTCLFLSHLRFSVISYGTTPLTKQRITDLSWIETWDFLQQ